MTECIGARQKEWEWGTACEKDQKFCVGMGYIVMCSYSFNECGAPKAEYTAGAPVKDTLYCKLKVFGFH